MKAYTSNILPRDAAHYQLQNAHITDGVLVMEGNSKASVTVTKEMLGMMTEFVRINVLPSAATDNYHSDVTLTVKARSISGAYFTHRCNVSSEDGTMYITELEMIAEEYDYLQVTIESKGLATITIWELCPEAVGDMEVVIDGVKQSLPKLLYDYNTTPIRVERSEQIVAMINCYLTNNTDLQGHFLMNFTASDRSTVHLRFFDTAMCELFSPVVHTVNPGYNTIEVPHAYLHKIVGGHSFYVTAQVTNGYLTVPIRSILYTIDGGYLAARLMDPGMDISDIAIKQLDVDSKPSEIWGIGVDNNQVIVKKRAYEPSQANILWEAEYIVGEGVLGAIEFDGEWVRRPGSIKHTIHTDSLPMIAYVDMKGVLWVYQRGMESAPLQIASGVTCISLVRGYKSTLYPNQDQGMILCWVQDGNVYYRQYAYFNGAYQWYPIEQLTDTGDITFVQVHRLNDFRVGIVTQSAVENVWRITDRTYVAQSVDTEIARASVDGMQTFIYMTAEEAARMTFNATQNTFDSVEEAQQDLFITFPGPNYITLYRDTIETWKEYLTLTVNGAAVPPEAYDLTIEANVLHFHFHEPIWGKVQLSWNRRSFWFHLDDTRKLLNTQSSYQFAWTIIHKMGHTQPKETGAGRIEGNVSFEIIPVQNIKNNYTEHINCDMGSLTFQVIPITNLEDTYNEQITCAVDGPLTFTCELVGQYPI
jgi:hypothetical protein